MPSLGGDQTPLRKDASSLLEADLELDLVKAADDRNRQYAIVANVVDGGKQGIHRGSPNGQLQYRLATVQIRSVKGRSGTSTFRGSSPD